MLDIEELLLRSVTSFSVLPSTFRRAPITSYNDISCHDISTLSSSSPPTLLSCSFPLGTTGQEESHPELQNL